MNRNKKIGILLAAVVAAGIPVASSVYSEQVKLVSKGAVSYDEDGDGVEETLIDSEDLKRLMGAISEAASSQSAYAGKLEELQKDLEQNRSATDKANKALIKDKAGLVKVLHSKFPGVELIDKLTEKASFEDIIAAVDSLASPSSVTAAPYTEGKNTNLGVDLSKGKIDTKYKDNNTLGVGEQITFPAGYYSTDTTISNGVKNNGSLTVNFTKALQRKTLSAGYYNEVILNTKQAYLDGYAEGKTYTTTQNVYNNVTVNPGNNGRFADGSTSSKTFIGPEYKGLDMNVIADEGYIFDGWTVSTSGTNIVMTANNKKAILTTKEYKQFCSGNIDLSDTRVTELNFDTKSVNNYYTYESEPVPASLDITYKIYVDGNLYKTVNLASTGKIDVYHKDAAWRWMESSTSANQTIQFPKSTSCVVVECTNTSGAGNISATMTVKGY